MSIRLMSEAWDLTLPQTEKMVLLCLCDHANDDGTCWPSMARVARKCSVTDRTVQRTVRQLEEKGILTLESAPGRPHKFHIDPRHRVTPDTVSPPTESRPHPRHSVTPPPTQCHPNHKEPSLEPSNSCASGDAPTLKPNHLKDEWNSRVAARTGLSSIRDLTPTRQQLCRARINQYPFDDFVTVFDNIERSPFLRGDLKWRGCSFDWALKRGNFQKILEGNYND